MGFKDDDVQEFPDDGAFDETDVVNEQDESPEVNLDTEVEPEPEVEAKAEVEPEPEVEAKAEAEAEAEAEPEQEPEPTKKKPNTYSRNIQKRLNREVRKREELRAENLALQERLAKVETTINTNQNENEMQVMSNRIANAQAMKNQLMEDGEYAEASKVDNDIMDMKIYQRDLQKQKDNVQTNPTTQFDEQGQQQPEIPEIQLDWMRNNRRFNRDPGYTAYVNEEYDALLEEGYDPEDANLYEELNKRVGITPQSAAPARPEKAPPPNTGTQISANRKSTSITAEDIKQMEDWGMNSKDPEARKEWLRSKSA